MDVFPLHLTDQIVPVPNIRTRTFFIVEECLDGDLLKSSLDKLIRNHWRILGARLIAKKKSGLLEYHLPKVFGPDYELFRWSTTQYDYSIGTTAASILSPARGQGPQLLPSMTEVDSWFRPADWPYHLADDASDSPIIYAHISLYKDATVICISIPHAVADQMGLASIMKAWVGLAGGTEPQPLISASEDILPGKKRGYKDYPTGTIRRKGRQRIWRRGEYARVIMPFIPDLVLNAKEEQATLFVPIDLVRALRKQHTEVLQGKHAYAPALSDSDILTAILVKV